MSIPEALRLLKRRWPWLLLLPLVLAAATYFFARRQPLVYASDTTLYTGIVSGYSLSGNAEADFNLVNNAYDNITNLATARATKTEALLRLLASHLWRSSRQPALLSIAPTDALATALPAALRQRLLGTDSAATLANVRAYALASDTNRVARLLQAPSGTYALASLDNLTAKRLNSSDLFRMEYESRNPQLSRTTLVLVTQTLLDEERGLHAGQAAPVVKYYEDEVARTKARLDKAEASNLAFNRSNNIINYGEQSKNIANEKEALAGSLTEMNQQYAGSQAALAAVRSRLGKRTNALQSSQQLLEQRQQLSRLNAAIANERLFGQQQEQGSSTSRVAQLQAEADKASQSLRTSVGNYYTRDNSAEGIPAKDLLDELVRNTLAVDEARAKLGVMNRRQQDFDREYQRMAPLGATLGRIEREIDLAEKAYLAALASLNSSKSNAQNVALTNNLKVVDPPNLPTGPKSSKVILLTAGAGIAGLVLVASIVLAMGLLDSSLRSPLVATRRTGLTVAGLTPDTAAPAANLATLEQRGTDQLVQHLLLKANLRAPGSGPLVVGVASMHAGVGKTTLTHSLATRAHSLGLPVLALYPSGSVLPAQSAAPASQYAAPEAAVLATPLAQLVAKAAGAGAASLAAARLVLVELPALREAALPAGVLRELGLVLLAVPATHTWAFADKQALRELRTATPAPVELVLVRVPPAIVADALA